MTSNVPCILPHACSQVCQVVLSFLVFPKPLSWKYAVGGALVAGALYWLQVTGLKCLASVQLGSCLQLVQLTCC